MWVTYNIGVTIFQAFSYNMALSEPGVYGFAHQAVLGR